MRRQFSILLFIGISMWSYAAGHRPAEQGSVVIDMSLGYQALLTSDPSAHNNIGTGARVGVGYRYRYSALLLQAGVEGQYGYMTHSLDTHNDTIAWPVNGLNSSKIISLNQRTNIYRQASVAVPLLVGAEMGSAYVLAGVKPAVSVWGSAQSMAHRTSWLDYYGQIDGTTEDELVRANLETTEPMAWQWQVYAHAELGWQFSTSRWHGSYARSSWEGAWALWADYGLLGQHTLAVGVKMAVLLHTGGNNYCRLCGRW